MRRKIQSGATTTPSAAASKGSGEFPGPWIANSECPDCGERQRQVGPANFECSGAPEHNRAFASMVDPENMPSEKLVARDGDVLVISYPEVTLPLARKYSSAKVGGLIYTRKLRDGDDVGHEYDLAYRFLKERAERDAVEKVRSWSEEFGE